MLSDSTSGSAIKVRCFLARKGGRVASWAHYLLAVDTYRQISSDLTAAMRARDTDTVRTLRSLLAAIGNAGATKLSSDMPEVSLGAFSSDEQRLHLEPADIDRIVEAEISERREALTLYQNAGRPDIASQMEHEIRVLSRYQTPS